MSESLWKKEFTLESLNQRGKGCGVEHMDVHITKATGNTLYATMPVDARTKQPLGILHGGSSVFLAESVGSLAANLAADSDHYCVGQEINANHLKSVSSGLVTAKASPVHIGRSSQVWSIEITDEKERLICISRLTMAVLKYKKE